YFISSVSEKIIDLIVKSKIMTEEATFDVNKKPQYSKYFVTWTLKHIYNNIILTAEFKNDKIEQTETKSDEQAEIKSDEPAESKSDKQAETKSDEQAKIKDIKKFVNIYDCLDNDDLVIVTYWGVLVWTFNTKDSKIELNYCWEDESGNWDWDGIKVIKLFYEIAEKTFDEKMFYKKNFDIKKLKKKSYFLPPSSDMNIIHYSPAFSQSKSPEDVRFLFNELIEKHIKCRFFLIINGQKLIEDITKEDELRKVLNGCIEQIKNDNETLNTQIFRIFS
ncbi:859_t:CDS:2, partial [Gigaspora margarita]